ncbi:hypothetical protein BH18ACI5_BH18ACI5_06750 [soil metagenome]
MSEAVVGREGDSYYAARDVLVRRYFSQPWKPGSQRYPVLDRATQLMGMVGVRDRLQTRARLMRPSHVHAIGVGGKNGTDEPAVVVYVTRKLPIDAVEQSELVPASIDGIPTDVVESSMARLAACTDTRRGVHRPLIGGVSIGRENGPSGTLAAFARSTKPSDPKDALFLLSNSHVLSPGGGALGSVRVVQPATNDGAGAVVATLARATRLTASRPITADAAIARLHDPSSVRNDVCTLGPVNGVAAPRRQLLVEKHGRSSGHTSGRIKTIGLAAEVRDHADRTLQFVDVFRVEAPAGQEPAVATLGDSGSLVFERGTGTAVGLLYAADEFDTFYLAQPIETICKELEIELMLDQ